MKKIFFLLIFTFFSIVGNAINIEKLGSFYNGLSDTCSVLMIIDDDFSYSIIICTGDKMASLLAGEHTEILDASIRLFNSRDVKKFRKSLLKIKEKYIEWNNLYINLGTSEDIEKEFPFKLKAWVQWRIKGYNNNSCGGTYNIPITYTGSSGKFGFIDISTTVLDYDKYNYPRKCYISLHFLNVKAIDHMLNILSDENINKYIELEKQKTNNDILNQFK